MTTEAKPYTRVYKEDIPSYMLAIWMGIEPMPTQLNGQSLTTRPGKILIRVERKMTWKIF
jgi:hypothetical protein